MFTLNKNEVEMGLKDVVPISVLRVVNPGFNPDAIEDPTFKDKLFSCVKQVSYQESLKQLSATYS